MIVTCPHATSCPGCTHIGVEYATQLEVKTRALATALGAYPELSSVEVVPARGAEPIHGYRTRAKWMVGADGEIGLYGRGDQHRVVDLPECRIAGALSLAVADEVRAFVRASGTPRGLHAIDVREVASIDGPRAMATLVVQESVDVERVRSLADQLERRVPRLAAIFANERKASSPQVLGPRTTRLSGATVLVDRVGTVDVLATAGSFVQAHRGQAAYLEERIVKEAARLESELGRPLRVLEAYAGAGAFGLALARIGCDVTFVESYAPAAHSITKAASAMGVGVRAIADDAESFIGRTDERFDLVVVDPPRRGLGASLRAGLGRMRPRSVAYVSCDPETFARDLAHLARLGLLAERALPIDMLPLTEHVEALAFLAPGPQRGSAELARTESFVAVDKPPHVAASEVAPSCERRALLDVEPGASGVVAFATSGAPTGLQARVHASVRCVVSGVARQRGRVRVGGAKATYERVRVIGGHSEISIALEASQSAALTRVLDRLASFGHPPLGDARRAHAAALRHAFDARGIDRTMVHVEHLRVVDGAETLEVDAPLAPDFARALERLR